MRTMNTSHSSPTFEIAVALMVFDSLAINRHAVRWQRMERDLVNFPELGGQSSIDRFDNGAAQSGRCHIPHAAETDALSRYNGPFAPPTGHLVGGATRLQ